MEEKHGTAFDPETLELFDREIEVDIETAAAGQPVHRTTIWLVVAGGVPLIRSYRGERGRWYREILVEPRGAIHAAGRRIPVRAAHVDDPATIDACSHALQAKYPDDPATPRMVDAEISGTTLRLEPA
jgi:hypothetical protein